jgi:hypothetical protein
MKKIIIILTVGAACALHAQTTNAPRTYFEACKSALNCPLVRGMSGIGALTGQVTYPVDIRVERLTARPATNTVYGVAVRTRLSRAGGLQVDYIDYDELDGLIHGLQLIAQADHTVVPMDDYEAVYRVRSGLSVAKISNGNKVVIAIQCGDANGTRNQIGPYVLDDLQRLLTAAKGKIDALAASGQ